MSSFIILCIILILLYYILLILQLRLVMYINERNQEHYNTDGGTAYLAFLMNLPNIFNEPT